MDKIPDFKDIVNFPDLKDFDFLAAWSFDLQMFAAEDEGRTEEPSEYKKRKAREEGNIPKSQELTAIIVCLLTFWTLSLLGTFFMRSLLEIMNYYLNNFTRLEVSTSDTGAFFIKMLWLSAKIVVPLMIAGVISAVLGNVIQGGFIFTTKKITMDFGKIFSNIGPNLAKMFFSGEAAFNLLKSLLKVTGVFAIAAIIIYLRFSDIIGMTRMSLFESFSELWTIIFQFVSIAGVLLLIFAIGDYIFQRHVQRESLKMSKQEIKEEIKEMDGDPEIRAKIREMERRLLTRKMIKDVPSADVVITNPTHIAVALKYDPSYMKAPVVIAKGEGAFARRIKEIAMENKVIIIENKPLARELYRMVEVGNEIPFELFEVVANIFKLVFQMKGSVAA